MIIVKLIESTNILLKVNFQVYDIQK